MNDLQVCWWPIERPKDYPKNARKWGPKAVEKVAASIKQYGWVQPVVCDKHDVIIIGHLRREAGRSLGLTQVPVFVASKLSPAQVRGLRLMDNRSHLESDFDLELLGPELEELRALDFDLSLTGFDQHEIDDFLSDPSDDDRANLVPAVPDNPVTKPGDLWLLGPHRIVCQDATSPEAVARLLGERKPLLMVCDPPYGISLDSEWRDRAGLNGHGPAEPSYMKHRTEGHTNTSISSDTRADWSEAFALVPSLQIVYVWHASVFTSDVLAGLLRLGFLYPQQIIWDKGRTVLTRTHYWYQHEPCWYLRKKNAPWFGKPGDNSTIWASPSPKFIMGASKEEKFDHPTQKPVELMRRPILNHTQRGGAVYDPFLGSGTTLIAAEMTGRACYGIEIDPKYCDVICQRFMDFSGKPATLEGDGRTFEQVKAERAGVAA
jgi:DNA modification methylase